MRYFVSIELYGKSFMEKIGEIRMRSSKFDVEMVEFDSIRPTSRLFML